MYQNKISFAILIPKLKAMPNGFSSQKFETNQKFLSYQYISFFILTTTSVKRLKIHSENLQTMTRVLPFRDFAIYTSEIDTWDDTPLTRGWPKIYSDVRIDLLFHLYSKNKNKKI